MDILDVQQVHVRYVCDDNHISFFIEDDGVGFEDRPTESSSMGLNIMRERAMQVGFHLTIDTHQGGGTRIEVKKK